MIKTNIANEYPHHLSSCTYTTGSIFVADYTQKTRTESVRKGVEIFVATPPPDIASFHLKNNNKLEIGAIVFDNRSFTYPNGNARSQCECVVFPKTADNNSWVLFVELKYCTKECNNANNLKKAVTQLYKTRTYYFQKGIFGKDNTCYLIASLPTQSEPFANFALTQPDMLRLKRKHNVVMRLKNSAEIVDDKSINV